MQGVGCRVYRPEPGTAGYCAQTVLLGCVVTVLIRACCTVLILLYWAVESWSTAVRESRYTAVSTDKLYGVQGLVLVSEPYYNEAGYEKQLGTKEGAHNSQQYNEATLLLVLQHMMVTLKVPIWTAVSSTDLAHAVVGRPDQDSLCDVRYWPSVWGTEQDALRACYAVSGTDLAWVAITYAHAVQRPVLTQLLSAYARAMRCPVLT
eukprot:3123770-Rhodomonas_salina.1